MFEPLGTTPRRAHSVVLSLGIHAALVAVLVVPPLLAVQDPAEPEGKVPPLVMPPRNEPIRTVFRTPGGDPNGGRPGAPPRRTAPAAFQPREVPVLPNPGTAPDDTPSDVIGAPGEDSPGPGRGLVDAPAGPIGDGPIDAHAPGVIEPVPIATPGPAYPEAARLVRIQGTVVLEAVIGTNGDVRDVTVLRSVHPLLDRAAVEAVSRWRYRPARVGDRLVSVFLTVKVAFSLR